MLPLTLVLLVCSLAAREATAQSAAHPVLEFDLAFPRNETYAPTQYFPIVLAVRNATAVWPYGLAISFTVFGPNSDGGQTFNIPAKEATSGPAPTALTWFAINGTSLTNGTEGHFSVVWSVRLRRACTDKETGPEMQSWGPFNVHFTTKKGAPLPDIESAMATCPPNPLAVIPSKFNGDCPVFASNSSTPAAANPCGLRSSAKEMAIAVDTVMLALSGCSSGTWQNLTQPCPAKANAAPRWIFSHELFLGLFVCAALYLW